MVHDTKKPLKYHAEYHQGEDELLDALLDERPVAGRVGLDKIELVEKIQSLVRGRMARKRVANIKGLKALAELPSVIQKKYKDYCNPDVQAVMQREGPFDYGTDEGDQKVQRVWKPMMMLADKNKYEG